MVNYKCQNCGGQLNIGGSGSFVCPFCGSKSFMSDSDFKGNEEFRQKLLANAKALADAKDNDYSQDSLWNAKESVSFTMDNSMPLNIDYMFKYSYDSCECYVAKESIVYLFENTTEADAFKKGLKMIRFPEADTKLPRCFPILKMELNLKDGKKALVFSRRPNFYPAEFFSPFPSGHLAWVISRMENLCCAFEYSGISHRNINPSSIFVNPFTHEGAIFGDWRKVISKHNNDDLTAVRKTAIALAENTREPMELYNFLNSKPAQDAYEDFSQWDAVIEKGFGGHKFETFKVK